jgi:hypothetical protein
MTFDDYGSQRQVALEQGCFKYPWLLVLDADERVDAELASELKSIAENDDENVLYRIRRKDYFLGKWIKHSTLYPTWHSRFFKHKYAHYEKRTVHEHPIIEGSSGYLKGHLLHYSFNKGLDIWIEKHRQYARLEAKEGLVMSQKVIDWSRVFSRNPVQRRRAIKTLSYHLPLRGLSRFVYMMFIRGAFLDGIQGIRYSWLISNYESWIGQEIGKLKKSVQKT